MLCVVRPRARDGSGYPAAVQYNRFFGHRRPPQIEANSPATPVLRESELEFELWASQHGRRAPKILVANRHSHFMSLHREVQNVQVARNQDDISLLHIAQS